MSSQSTQSVKVQPELLLPGESPLAHCGEMTAADRAGVLADALRGCPSMVALSDEQRRWAVTWALSDRQKLGMRELAAVAGIGERSAYRYQTEQLVRKAEAEIVATLTPPGFAALREAGEEVAARLAGDLRFGRARLAELSAGERYLLDLAFGGPVVAASGSRTTVRLGGETGSAAEVTIEQGDSRESHALRELRERLLGRHNGGSEAGGCQSLPGGEDSPGGEAGDVEGQA